MTKLSIAPYKGTKDYYPEQKRIQNYIFTVWRNVAERYGYEEYGAPILEPLDLYLAKSGQELAGEQTYAFTDRGGRTVAVRPEMTPSVSRMVAGRRQELGYPARLYSIANCMRYERPQRGREREFWQLNLDMFGVDSMRAEAEMIILASETMKAFGANESMFKIHINNRELIDVMMRDYLELDQVQAQMMTKLFDRRNKITPQDFIAQATDIFGEAVAREGLQKIEKIINVDDIVSLPEVLREHEVTKNLALLFEEIATYGITNAEFDVTLMRGLDYYTGTVFEVFDMHPDNNRSMFGGGRYDGLVGLFGVEPVPTIGMAPGLTPMTLFLESHNLLPQLQSRTDAAVLVLGEDSYDGAQKLAAQLREEGLNIEVDISGRKLDKQIKSVLKKQIAHIIFVGESEVREKQYMLKNVDAATEEKMSFERLVSVLADHRASKHDELDELGDFS